MALSKKALQLKREKKKKKRKIKTVVESFSSDITYHHWPIYECWVSRELWTNGIGTVIVTRKSDAGEIAYANYLLDVFCLGLKDCFVHEVYSSKYKDLLDQINHSAGELASIEPIYANTLINKTIEYADSLGFKPHKDFTKVKKMLKNIPVDDNMTFTFGQEGKPCYIQGPNDSPVKINKVIHTLNTHVGEGNYHFILEVF